MNSNKKKEEIELLDRRVLIIIPSDVPGSMSIRITVISSPKIRAVYEQEVQGIAPIFLDESSHEIALNAICSNFGIDLTQEDNLKEEFQKAWTARRSEINDKPLPMG